MKGGRPFSAAFLSICVLRLTHSLFLPMPKLGILNSHKYAARGDVGIRLQAASFDPFSRDRGAAAAGEEISLCNVHRGLGLVSASGQK